MRNQKIIAAAFLLTTLQAAPAVGGPCDAYYRFDGDLSDAGGNSFDGQMVGNGGASPGPTFVEGRSGQALLLDGTSAMRAFLDLRYDLCPQVTVTAWIKAELHPQQVIWGSSHGLFLMASQTDISLRVGGDDLWARNSIFPNGGWLFVTGTWDMTSGQASVHWRGREVNGRVGSIRMETEQVIWVGALFDRLDFTAKNLVIDELRFVGSIEKPVDMVAAAAGSASAAVPATVDSGAETATGLAACNVQEDCATGTYCALDNTCHPETHLPKP